MSVSNILPQFACIRNALSGVEASCFFVVVSTDSPSVDTTAQLERLRTKANFNV